MKFPQNGTGNDVRLYLECCWENNGYGWRAQFDGNDFEKARRLFSSTSLRFSDYNAVVAFLKENNISCPHKKGVRTPFLKGESNDKTHKAPHFVSGGLCHGK